MWWQNPPEMRQEFINSRSIGGLDLNPYSTHLKQSPEEDPNAYTENNKHRHKTICRNIFALKCRNAAGYNTYFAKRASRFRYVVFEHAIWSHKHLRKSIGNEGHAQKLNLPSRVEE